MLFKQMKLGPKLILLFLTVGLIPMLTATGITFFIARNNLQNEINGKLRSYIEQKKSALEMWFEQNKGAVNMAGASRDVYASMNIYHDSRGGEEWNRRNLEVLSPFCQTLKDKYDYTDVFVTDEKGFIISSTNKSLVGGDLTTRDYIRKAFTGQVVTSSMFYSDVAHKVIVVVASPIYSNGPTGHITGVMGVFLDGSEFSRMTIDGLETIGKSADAYLVNENQIVLTTPKFNQGFEVLKSKMGTIGAQKLAAAVRAGDYNYQTGQNYLGYRGVHVLGQLGVIHLGDFPAGLVMEIDYNEAFGSVNQLRNFIFGLVILIICSVVIIGWLASRSIIKPILIVNETLNKIAQGDLTVGIDIKRSDEIGELANQENTMVERVSNMIRQIIESAERVKKATAEIVLGNQDLSQRTQEQASTLEEISATMEELTTSIQQVGNNSGQADQLSQTTLEVVQEGENSIKETIEAMNEISVSSNQIAEIIKVVNDIAFQTNLLALNAAVEAARAGEQGRGFAVVAAEVRNLAGRTAESAKEIEKLISDSVKRVERGNMLVQKSSEMLEQIVTNTKRTADVIVEVASAMREQSGASQQIQASTEQLNQVTQQNAALVEEITSSSQAMSAEAESLREVVNQFKVVKNQAEFEPKDPGAKNTASHKIRIRATIPKPVIPVQASKRKELTQDSLDKF